ncbi:MAG: metallophosphoesterase family protein, partial [Planctomycetes bacterium]|nr:metallophosphoesterase family protein [Planctomycetota bacterium]
MRYGVFGDVHGNLEALDAVIDAMHTAGVERFLCLGDIVGYGADPAACIDRVRRLDAVIVAGNHDLATAQMLDISHFNAFARETLEWCRRALGAEDRRFLEAPNLVEVVDGRVTVFHGTLHLPEEFGYIQSLEDALLSFSFLRTPVGFFGHSHVPVAFRLCGDGIAVLQNPRTVLTRDCRYLFNPGSVGQPRDGDARAAFAVYDTARAAVQFHRVAYDVETAQDKIRQAGLPEIIWER